MLLVTMLTTLLFGNNVRADYYDDFYDNEYDYEYSDADDLEKLDSSQYMIIRNYHPKR